MSDPIKSQHMRQDRKRILDLRTLAWALPLAIISLAVIVFLYPS